MSLETVLFERLIGVVFVASVFAISFDKLVDVFELIVVVIISLELLSGEPEDEVCELDVFWVVVELTFSVILSIVAGW